MTSYYQLCFKRHGEWAFDRPFPASTDKQEIVKQLGQSGMLDRQHIILCAWSPSGLDDQFRSLEKGYSLVVAAVQGDGMREAIEIYQPLRESYPDPVHVPVPWGEYQLSRFAALLARVQAGSLGGELDGAEALEEKTA